MEATILVDNIGYNGMKAEWGLCIYIVQNGTKILLDTGASNLFLENAKKEGISLEDVDYAVLSHAHYDHANGMSYFLELNDKAKFYLQKKSSENCYSKRWIFRKYIGIPKGILEKFSDRIEFIEGDYSLTDEITIISHKTKGLDAIGRREHMYVKENGKWNADDFAHEQSLVFETEKGLVIFNSCCHGGADTIINEVKSTYNQKHIHAIVGGFHLFNKAEEEVRALAVRIMETGIDKIYTGHCTGDKAYQVLESILGDKLQKLQVGLKIEV